MSLTTFHSSGWFHGLTLRERLESLRAFNGGAPNSEINIEHAERRVKLWRSQAPFTADAIFAQRLSLDGLNETNFLQLLGEPIEAVQRRSGAPPPWLDQISQAFSQPVSVDSPSYSSFEFPPLPDVALRGQPPLEFLKIVEPLISHSRRRLHDGLRSGRDSRTDLPFDLDTAEAILFTQLPWRVLTLLSRTVVYELRLARLVGRLEGETPAERYQNFLLQLCEPARALKLLEEYPVLARQLVVRANQWVAFSLELVDHLCTDWESIRSTFSPSADPGLLVDVDGRVADYHRQGRAVQILKFASGLKLVYKPKALAVDVHFQELLSWLNERGATPPLQSLKTLDRGRHGWVEFVSAAACDSEPQLHRFYERQGAYLALLYVLEATDFHLENLIAVGEHPVLIDLESLFQGRPAGASHSHADFQVGSQIEESVMRVLLLPQRLGLEAESDGIDMGGLSGAGGQLSLDEQLVCEAAGTDEMRFTRRRASTPASYNLPTLNGQPINPLRYADAVAEGFTAMSGLLMKHRHALLADSGPLAAFANDEVRAIVSDTRTYGRLLSESLHPVLLGDALERDRYFDKLWDGVQDAPYLAKVIAAEREDLQRGDIPMFTARPNSGDIFSSMGERIPDFYAEPALQAVRRRVENLDQADLTRQQWFISASLATLTQAVEHAHRPRYSLGASTAIAHPDQFVAAACAIGDRLIETALRGADGTANWIGLSLVGGRQYSLAPLGLDLYSGVPGLALFLAHLGAVTGSQPYTELAQAALATVRRQMNDDKLVMTAIGAFDGWGGLIYTFTRLATIWNQPTLLSEAEAICERLPSLIEKDDNLDFISGSAGCLVSLIGLHRLTASGRALAAAIACGDRLVSLARPMERGLAWHTALPASRPLAGFGHGATGIAWALLELAALTGNVRYRGTALQAMEYERGLYSPEAGNWPDFRDFEKLGLTGGEAESNFLMAWCHGAPGIGLARLLALKHIDNAAMRAEIEAALTMTLAHGFGLNHSLCHGDLGNLELLWQAAESLGDERWRIEATRFASAILANIQANGWQCGLPQGVESPGLMTGLAGIGYGLLRAVQPKQLPSVLALALPNL